MPYQGVSVLERVPGGDDWRAGLFTVYRFHECDESSYASSICGW